MYTGKVVLITGVIKGVGNKLAKYFLDNNATVIGLDIESVGSLYCATYCQCDLAIPRQIIDAMSGLKGYKIDIVINNAATLTSQYALKMKTEDAEKMVQVDLLAPFLIARESVKLMKNGGQIVNISSMAVALEPMGDSMYAACKAGLNKMSNIIAKEFAGFGITVNTLAISAIETDMLKQLNREKIDKVVAGLPIPRYATMDDITNVIDFFCSPKSNYITAQTIYLGGVHA